MEARDLLGAVSVVQWLALPRALKAFFHSACQTPPIIPQASSHKQLGLCAERVMKAAQLSKWPLDGGVASASSPPPQSCLLICELGSVVPASCWLLGGKWHTSCAKCLRCRKPPTSFTITANTIGKQMG